MIRFFGQLFRRRGSRFPFRRKQLVKLFLQDVPLCCAKAS